MGIVASLAALPVAQEIAKEEKTREIQKRLEEEERLRRLRAAEMFRQGDFDLYNIKR
jgi:hypothetical protein